MSKSTVSFEIDYPHKAQTLIALAHILMHGHEGAQPPSPFLADIESFFHMLLAYLDNMELSEEEILSVTEFTEQFNRGLQRVMDNQPDAPRHRL